MSRLVFEPTGHTYTLEPEGRQLPSVTTILKSAGIIDDRFYTDQGAHNGTRRHALTELIDENKLDWGSVLDEDLPYVEAWGQFKEDHDAEWDYIEQPMYHEVYNYAGMLDRLGRVKGTPALVDIKTGAKAAWHHLQALMYGMMVSLPPEEGQDLRCMIVYLKESGKYQVVEADKSMLPAAINALGVCAWKIKYGKGIK